MKKIKIPIIIRILLFFLDKFRFESIADKYRRFYVNKHKQQMEEMKHD